MNGNSNREQKDVIIRKNSSKNILSGQRPGSKRGISNQKNNQISI